ncbi:MAG: FAD-binding protein [Syntrophorhabdales bacterium]|jgi:succinate dehydrogenase/fumarate reductase flavoprotein subunit
MYNHLGVTSSLLSACFVVKAVLTASLARKESRGSFYRKDFASQDDVNWRRNSCLQYNSKEGTFALASRTPDG